MTRVRMNLLKYTGRKRLAIDFENDELYAACKAVEPFLDRLVLVGGWAFRALMNIWRKEERETKDTDFAVELVSREAFQEISNHLLANGFKHRNVSDKLKKRKILEYSFEQQDKWIEILPVGEFARDITDLDLKEYRLAFDDNEMLNVRNAAGDALSLKVVHVCSLVVMKVFSYTDRWDERRKDLTDLEYLTEHYGVENDKYGLTVKLKEWFEEKNVPYEMASSHLLGREIQKKLQDELFIETEKRLIKIIERISDSEREETALTKRLNILLEYFQDKYE